MSAALTLNDADRERIETAIELLVGILDAMDAPSADMEPDDDDKGADDYGEPDDFGEEDDFGEPDFRNAGHLKYGDDQRFVLDQIVAGGHEPFRQD